MPGDFDFLNDDPKPRPKSPPAKKPEPIVERLEEKGPPRAEAVDEEDLAFDDGAEARHAYPPDKSTRAEPGRRTKRGHDDPDRRSKKGLSPITLLMFGGPAILVIGGAIALIMMVRGKDPEAKEKDKGKGATTIVATVPSNPPPKKEIDDPNSPSREIVERVKKATVRVLVQFKNGKQASGSGFVEKSSGLVVTNAHVVGLKDPGDSPAAIINLVVNSGLGEKEYRLSGDETEIVVDAQNDLALIRPRLLEVGERHVVPDGLVVARNPQLAELQSLFVFGFPLGSAIGAEISVRPTKITSLRKDIKDGKLRLIQVEGGMTRGNSGGPIVDIKGNVVGVAVAGIKDEAINFAVPSEKVIELLARRNK